jgi:PAS domain S-box-containing protein
MASSIELAARLAAVVELQQESLSAAADSDRVAELIVNRIPSVTNADGAAIELVDGEDLVVAATAGAVPAEKGTRSSLSGSLLQDDIIRQIDLRMQATSGSATIVAAITIPLIRGGLVVGLIAAYSTRAKSFDDLDAYTLQLLGGMSSAALIMARAFRDKQESEARYRLLFERNVAGVFRSTRDGRILDCNDAFAGTLGYASKDEVLARSSWDMYAERGDRDKFLEKLDRMTAMTNVRLELKRKDGTLITGLVNIALIPGDDGVPQLLGTVVEAT